jgi:signal transduction histidine kinase
MPLGPSPWIDAPAAHTPPPKSSQFEQMAAIAISVPQARSTALSVLLGASILDTQHDHRVLQAIWANEAMHRAYNMVLLFDALEHKEPSSTCHRHVLLSELRHAQQLAELFKAISAPSDPALLSCSRGLRVIAGSLVELFEPTVGQLELKTCIEPITLPAYKRRALLLAVSELVINALRHAFSSREEGLITIRLDRRRPSQAEVSVEDDGDGITGGRPMRMGIASDLVSLLESELTYHSRAGRGTCVKMTFPA